MDKRMTAMDQIFSEEFGVQHDEEVLAAIERCTDDELEAWMYDLGWVWDGDDWVVEPQTYTQEELDAAFD